MRRRSIQTLESATTGLIERNGLGRQLAPAPVRGVAAARQLPVHGSHVAAGIDRMFDEGRIPARLGDPVGFPNPGASLGGCPE